MPKEEREPMVYDAISGEFEPETWEWKKKEEQKPPEIKGTELVPISADDLLRSQVKLELNENNQPRFATEAEIEAEVQRRKREVGAGAQAAAPEGEVVIEGEYREVPGEGAERKVPKEERQELPGRVALERVLGMTDEARKKKALEEWQLKFADTATAEDWDRASSALGVRAAAEAKAKVEIPNEEKTLKRFLRERIREVIRITTNEDNLSVKAVTDEVKLMLGFDRETMAKVDLFKALPADIQEDVRGDIEGEIEHRCMLRSAELKEWSYKGMADKGAAVNRFLNDIKGSESGAASAAIIDRDTFRWLKDLEDEGDGLERAKIDRVLQLLTLLGENQKGYIFDPELAEFQKFLGVKDTAGKDRNLFDPSYPISTKEVVVDLMKKKFGEDSYTLAWQLFQAFKEEGNYNWQHYLSRDFTFSGSRMALAEILVPPVYIGSKRVYIEEVRLKAGLAEARKEGKDDVASRIQMKLKEIKDRRKALRDVRDAARKNLESALTGRNGATIAEAQTRLNQAIEDLEPHRTFADELRVTALSALRSAVFVADPGEPGRPLLDADGEKVIERDILLSRARRGVFLTETPFESTELVPDGKLPQQLSYNTIKDGEKLRGAIVAVGDLGKEGDKSGRIEAAITALADLRSVGESLVVAKVVTREELDRQIEIEARNIIWEMSIENPQTVQDLAVQVKGKQNFLAPSQLNTLFQRMGGRTSGGDQILGSNEVYAELAKVVLEVRSKTWEIFEDLEGEDEALVDREKHAKDFVELPTERGKALIDNIGRINKFMTKAVAMPAAAIISPLADILFPEFLFGKRKKS
ncbi:MAG: hypothetical protein AAB548_00890 [Patescibacteria group bacterium]